MSIYMITWKTVPIDGESSEGSFISDDEINSVDEAVKARDRWREYIETGDHPYRLGGEVFITGAFKL